LALPWERDPVRLVLALEPAGPESELDAAAAHRVDVRDGDRQRARQPEGDGADEGAQTYAARLAREPRERDPRVGGAREGAGTRRRVDPPEVIGAEEAVEPAVLGRACDAEQVVVGGALLGLGPGDQL